MKIYVLIILCIFTLKGLFKIIKSLIEEDGNLFIASLITLILGIIAIVFQSINL
jgi:hypothetical protein